MFLEDDIKTGYVNSHSEQQWGKKNPNWNAVGALDGIFFYCYYSSLSNHLPNKMSCTTYVVGKKKINFQFMYLNSRTRRRVQYGTMYHQRDVFQGRGPAIVIHFG